MFPDVPSGYRMSAFGQYEDDDSASTLKQRDYKDATDLVTQPQAFNWQQGDAEYSLRDDSSSLAADSRPAGLIPQSFDEMNFSTDDETHHVLRAGTKQSTGVMVPQAIPIQDTREVEKHQNGLGVGQEGDPSYTVDTTSRAGVAVPQAFRKAATAQSSEDAESWVADGQANTLNVFDVGDTRTTHAIVEPKEEMVDFGRTSDRIRMNADTAATLQAGGGGEGAKTGLYMVPSDPYVLQGTMVNRTDQNGPGGFGWQRDTSYTLHTADPDFIAGPQYGVRRLTPVECERLQAFPDGWTEPAGSDSARYKAMGNAVTVNVVRWILNRMVQAG